MSNGENCAYSIEEWIFYDDILTFQLVHVGNNSILQCAHFTENTFCLTFEGIYSYISKIENARKMCLLHLNIIFFSILEVYYHLLYSIKRKRTTLQDVENLTGMYPTT